jgi:uncharacterized protein YjbI with pentapeptide repeats
LRSRWESDDGKEVITRLYQTRVNLPDLAARTVAATTNFTPNDLRGLSFVNSAIEDTFLFSNLDLSYSNFSNAVLAGSFQESILINCIFHSAHFNGGYFAYANLTNASFENAYMHDVEFDLANLTNVNFKGARLIDVSFSNVDLTTANLKNIELGRVKFYKTKLKKEHQLHDLIINSKTVLCPEHIIWVE